MRIFAIGDIHGEFQKLANLILLLNSEQDLDLTKDRLVFLGDYIDRGKDSLKVLKLVKALADEFPETVTALAGNHEHMMLDHHKGEDPWGFWLQNGGKAAQRSFYKHHGSKKCPGNLLRWVNELPLSVEMDGFFFSHAPIPKDDYRNISRRGKEDYTQEELIWSRNDKITEAEYARQHPNGVIGVCGHIHAIYENVFHPRFYDHYIFTDAGCGCHKDAPLCAVEVKTRQVIYSL